MGDTMTAAAGVEFFQHRLGMGPAMAFITSFDGFVFIRMASGALEGRVFCVAFLQHLFGLAVTVRADGIRRSVGIGNFEGFVRRMTGKALIQWRSTRHHPSRRRYGSGVLLMTLQAVRHISVFCMVTGCAVEVGMTG